MQKFAVGLEQIVWDQEYYNGRFQEEFKQTELNLGAVSLFLFLLKKKKNYKIKFSINRKEEIF